eukprot:TRINITY_DN9856_c0_g1_i2.p3 TRINITY_DN9856_c0_g1~~TRINITY_DN9856_c0_g1_i2.p3  ORF type:complete len:124 (-),score=20.13 TRINITY_DN9856_c0_g1_i2:29-400(-)
MTAITTPQMLAASKAGLSAKQSDLPVFLCFIFASVFSVVLLMFAGWQYYLIFRGQTQFEFYDDMHKRRIARRTGQTYVGNEFDLGWRQNFNEFFGVTGYWWTFVLPTFVPPSLQEHRETTYTV